jgi:hypothetical protein
MNDDPKNTAVSQEEDVVPRLRVLGLFVVTGLVGLLLGGWAWLNLKNTEKSVRPSLVFPERELGPRRNVSHVLESIYGERSAGQVLNEQKHREIESFRWVDRDRRIVAIPIDDAMALLSRRVQP